MAGAGQDQGCPIAVLDVGRMEHRRDRQAVGVGEQVALAPPGLRRGRLLTFLPASYPRRPPLSVVLTDWLSMTPADGLASRPAASRTRITSAWLIVCHNPASRHRQKNRRTVENGGSSLGSSRHRHPVVNRYSRALTTSRLAVVRGRPNFFGTGSSISISAHSALVGAASVGDIACIAKTIAAILRLSGFSPHLVFLSIN
jgi:hypothetical protein